MGAELLTDPGFNLPDDDANWNTGGDWFIASSLATKPTGTEGFSLMSSLVFTVTPGEEYILRVEVNAVTAASGNLSLILHDQVGGTDESETAYALTGLSAGDIITHSRTAPVGVTGMRAELYLPGTANAMSVSFATVMEVTARPVVTIPTVADFTFHTPEDPQPSIELTKPPGVLVGDLLLLIVGSSDFTNNETWDAVTGYTKLFEIGNATSDTKQAVYWRIADGTEPLTQVVEQFAARGSDYLLGWYVQVIEFDATTPIDILDDTGIISSGLVQTLTIPAVETVTNNALAFSLFSFDDATNTFTTSGVGWPTSYPTNQYLQTDGTLNGIGAGWLTKTVPTAGTSEDQTSTTTGAADGCCGNQWAIRPAAAGGDVTITAIPGVLSVEGNTSIVTPTENIAFSPAPGELSLSGATATVQAGNAVTIEAVPGELGLAGATPIVTAVDSQTIVAVPGELSLEGSTAILTVNNVTHITSIPGELSLSGTTPIVTLTTVAFIQPAPGELSLSGATAIVINSADLPATLTTRIQGPVMQLGGKTTNVFAGESVYFVLGLPEEDPNRWTAIISVKNYPGDVEFINREILPSGTAWIGFLTSTETAALTTGTYYLTGTLTNNQDNRVVEQSYRFKIASGWTN